MRGNIPPKTYQVFLVFGPRILHCYKKPVAHPGRLGMHPYRHPQCTETGREGRGWEGTEGKGKGGEEGRGGKRRGEEMREGGEKGWGEGKGKGGGKREGDAPP